MKILNYDEVEDEQLTEMMLACFNHVYSKDQIEEMIDSDRRIPEWDGELFAVEDGRAVGSVGLIYPRAEKFTGERIDVGGIRNVCARPSESNRGIVTKLMDRAHEILSEEVDHSFLMTSKSLVAHNLYKKLGYETVHVPPKAYKKCENKRSDVEFKEEKDPEYVRSLYSNSVDDLTGLVVREKDYWEMAEARGWPDNEDVKIAYRDGERIGYAMMESSRNSLTVKELAAEKDGLLTLLKAMESRCDKEQIVLTYANPSYEKDIRTAGFSWTQDLWYRVMVKNLNGENDESLRSFGQGETFHTGVYEIY